MRHIRKLSFYFTLCLLLAVLGATTAVFADPPEQDYSTLTLSDGVYRNSQGVVFTLRTDGSYTAWVGTDADKTRNNSEYGSESGNYNEGVVHIPDQVCYNGQTYTVTTITKGAFRYNEELKKIEMGSSVRLIEPRAFCYCPNFTEFSFYEENSSYCTVDGILFDSEKVTVWSVPGGKTLERYEIPAGTVYVGEGAFFGCVNIPEIVIGGDVRMIYDRAFYDAVGIERFYVNSGVVTIGSQVLENYIPKSHPLAVYNEESKLQTVYIYDGVRSIGSDLLVGCKAVQTLRLPFLGSSRSTGSYLSELFVRGSGTRDNVGVPASLTGVAIADGMLHDEAFRKCEHIETITLGRSITAIPLRCFAMCTALNRLDMGLTEQMDGANHAEAGIVRILPHVATIGNWAFFECMLVSRFEVDEANAGYANDYWGVLYDKEFLTLLCYPPASDCDYYCVKGSAELVYDSSFCKYCKFLKTVNVPNRDTALDPAAFDDSLSVYRCVHRDSKALPADNTSGRFFIFEDFTPRTLEIHRLADNLANEAGVEPAFRNLHIIVRYPGVPVMLDPLDYDMSYTGLTAGPQTATASYKQTDAQGNKLSVSFHIYLFETMAGRAAKDLALGSDLAAGLAALNAPKILVAFYNADGQMLGASYGALIDNVSDPACNSLRCAAYVPAQLLKKEGLAAKLFFLDGNMAPQSVPIAVP